MLFSISFYTQIYISFQCKTIIAHVIYEVNLNQQSSHNGTAPCIKQLSQQIKIHHMQISCGHWWYFSLIAQFVDNILITRCSRKHFLFYIIDKWHKLSTYTSNQYQALALTQHYAESTQHLLSYLENVDHKMEASKDDVPLSVQAEVKEKHDKMKVRHYTLSI